MIKKLSRAVVLLAVGLAPILCNGQYSAALRQEAEKGNADAQTYLGCAYDLGQGVPQDHTEAVKWFRKAAEQGDAESQCDLGAAYYKGKGVPQDYTEAVKWSLKAAEQGKSDGQELLCVAYEYGNGVPQDLAEAYKWYLLATANGREASAKFRDDLMSRLTPEQITEGQRRAAGFIAKPTTIPEPQIQPLPVTDHPDEAKLLQQKVTDPFADIVENHTYPAQTVQRSSPVSRTPAQPVPATTQPNLKDLNNETSHAPIVPLGKNQKVGHWDLLYIISVALGFILVSSLVGLAAHLDVRRKARKAQPPLPASPLNTQVDRTPQSIEIHFTCPKCQQPLEAPADMAGAVIACPACSVATAIPPPPSRMVDQAAVVGQEKGETMSKGGTDRQRRVSKIANRSGITVAVILPMCWLLRQVIHDDLDSDVTWYVASALFIFGYIVCRLVGWSINAGQELPSAPK